MGVSPALLLVWAHPAEDATALVEVARLGAFWDSPGRQPGVPIGLRLLQKNTLWEWAGHTAPAGQHTSHTDYSSSTRPESLGCW